jgi:hypothetical protein
VPLLDGGPPPRLESDSYKAEFGEVYRGEKLHHTFKLKNTGEGDLQLQEIRSSCSCAVAKLTIGEQSFGEQELRDKKRIGTLKKGEEATLEVELKTALSTTPGATRRSRRRSASTARPAQPAGAEPRRDDDVALHDRAGEVRVRPREARLGGEALGDDLLRQARPLRDHRRHDAQRRAAEGDDREHRRGGADSKLPPTWRIDAELSPAAPLGSFNTHVDLAVNHERVKEIMIPVYLTVVPERELRRQSARRRRVPRLREDDGRRARRRSSSRSRTATRPSPTCRSRW